MPNVRIMSRMCSHSRASMGSSDMASPSGILEWPPWARVRVGRTRRERRSGGMCGRRMAFMCCVYCLRCRVLAGDAT